jgi:hypothetical protein
LSENFGVFGRGHYVGAGAHDENVHDRSPCFALTLLARKTAVNCETSRVESINGQPCRRANPLDDLERLPYIFGSLVLSAIVFATQLS